MEELISSIVILIDTREKSFSHITDYFDRKDIKYKKKALAYGDYSFMLEQNEKLSIPNALNIDGLSEATIQKFISLGWLKSIQDIYYLTKYEKQMKTLDGFGSKSVSKLFNSIEKSRNTTFDRFIYALSIPLVGKTASKVIAEAEDYQFESFVRDMTHPGAKFFSHIPGIGDSIIN